MKINKNNNNNKIDESQKKRAGSNGRVNGTKVKLEASISMKACLLPESFPM